MSRIPLIKRIFRQIYGQAGLELAAEVASRQMPWPDVPHPCGIIAGTKSFSWKSPISWLTTILRILPGKSVVLNAVALCYRATGQIDHRSAQRTIHQEHLALSHRHLLYTHRTCLWVVIYISRLTR